MKTAAYLSIAVVAAGAGYGIYQLTAGTPQAEVAHHAAPPAPAPEQAQEQGAPSHLPEFSLPDLAGQTQSIRGWTDKSMIVNFWATWCAPCRREIPLLRQLQAAHGEEGFQVVGVAVDFRDDVVKYAQEIGIDYPVLVGEEDGMEAVTLFGQGSLGFPFTVFTDNQQRIVAMHLGEIHEAQAQVLLDAVRRVNRGELTPEAARAVAAKQLSLLDAAAS
jgi:thiol-disulfide isomerase/thioredoxin